MENNLYFSRKMKLKIIILISFVSNFFPLGSGVPLDKSKKLNNMVEEFGYPFEKHNVQTEDGYILEIHNIPFGRNETKESAKKDKAVVLVMHGTLGSSADWIITGSGNALALLLVDKGYNVWLGNNRGNTFSKNHTSKMETSYGFWDFSWHEMGMHDLPTMIDYILKTTGQQKLFYISYSQGSTQFFVMGSLKPEYNDKIRLAVALAPAVYLGNVKGVLASLAKLSYPIGTFLGKVGHVEVLPASSLLRVVTKMFCEDIPVTEPLCFAAISSVVGINVLEKNTFKVATFLPYFPAGCSTKQLLHYGFGFENPNTFRQYDYGSIENLEKYQSITPPDYPLENIKVPIAIYHGTNDALVDPLDIQVLQTKLKNIVRITVGNGTLNHIDFNYGSSIREDVYDDVLKLMEGY